RPEAGVLQREFGVGVVGDLDLDHPVDACRIPPGFLSPFGDGRQQLLGVELHALAGSADESVTCAPGVARDERASRGDVDGDAALWNVVDRRADGVVVLAL